MRNVAHPLTNTELPSPNRLPASSALIRLFVLRKRYQMDAAYWKERSMKCQLAIILLAVACIAATTAPATQPSTQPTVSQRYAIENDSIQTTLKAVPKNLIPPQKESPTDAAARIKKVRAWGKANLEGKTITMTGYVLDKKDVVAFPSSMADVQITIGCIPLPEGLEPGDKVSLSGTVSSGGFLVDLVSLEGKYFTQYLLVCKNPTVTKTK
jgi:hypothetical protein